MFKMIGALIVLGSSTWAGIEFSRHFSDRPKQLRLFREALQTMDAEIMYGHSPLGDISLKIASQMNAPISTHFENFAKKLENTEVTVKTSWFASLNEIWGDTALNQNEYEILKQFGENLGKHDRYTQQKHIILTLTHLEREEEEARRSQKKYEQMTKSIGILFGLLCIILLF